MPLNGPAERDAVAESLRRVLGRDARRATAHPGGLRLALRRELGQAADLHRGAVDLLVAGLDENLPGRLLAAPPATVEETARAAARLRDARGWTSEASGWVVAAWMHALDLDHPPPTADAAPTRNWWRRSRSRGRPGALNR